MLASIVLSIALQIFILKGIASITTWSTFWSVLTFGLLRVTGVLRVSEETEIKGLDLALHGQQAYDILSNAVSDQVSGNYF